MDTSAPATTAVTQVTNLVHIHPTVVREQMHFAWIRLPAPAHRGTVVRSSLRLRRVPIAASTEPGALHFPRIVLPGEHVVPRASSKPAASVAGGRNGPQSMAAGGYRQAPASTVPTRWSGVAAGRTLTVQGLPRTIARSGGNAAAAIHTPLRASDRPAPVVDGGAWSPSSAGKPSLSGPLPEVSSAQRKLRRPVFAVPGQSQYAVAGVLPMTTRLSEARGARDLRSEMPAATLPPASLEWRKQPNAAERMTADAGRDAEEAARPVAGRTSSGSMPGSQPARPGAATMFDPAVVERLVDDVIRRIDRRGRIERERRGL
ncbi:hypothetical protein OIU34_07440 [Pararhizobium sp. BT-229]|uniref:hypothetical protein n=1 Tax=Pararhizobium sp. BT-229 TaxID=2986923 RepID=UPI0021F7E92F|nr:hypothetical protein [Pararhizobium sp. BT-229]MCV9961734.1 hypothetical protein [Pararhizobium sp. BT-229]